MTNMLLKKLTESTIKTYNIKTTYFLEFGYTNFHDAISYAKTAEIKLYSLVCLII